MSPSYLAPTSETRGELREKGSRFLGLLLPVADEVAAREALERLRSEYPDATHHCWAWRIGQPARERASDDGEPPGTAGVPMLRMLTGRKVSDALSVVVRWYGGTKLGKGGLARAYSGAVRETLAAARLVEKVPTFMVDIELPYERVGAIKRLLRPPQIVLENETYGETVRITLRVATSVGKDLESELAALGVTLASH